MTLFVSIFPLILALSFRTVALVANPNFWIDKAMLFDSFKHAPIVFPWTILPLYDQATPFLPLLIWKGLIGAFGANEILLRLPAYLAACGGLLAFWFTARGRLGTTEIVAGMLIPGFSQVAIIQAAEFKHYSFEFLATSLIVLAAWILMKDIRNTLHLAVFAAIAVTALTYSFCSPIVVCACGGAVIATHMTKCNWRWADLVPISILGFIYAIIVGVWYINAVHSATFFQFVGNARFYDTTYFVLWRPQTWLNAGNFSGAMAPAFGSEGLDRVEPSLGRRLVGGDCARRETPRIRAYNVRINIVGDNGAFFRSQFSIT